MKIIKYFVFLFVSFQHILSMSAAGQCNEVVFTDNFSSSSSWTTIGSEVSIGAGKCNFVNAYDGSYNKIYKSVGSVLSDTYFKAEFDLSITSPNPSGNGSGHDLLCLTAGTLDWENYDASMSYQVTNQDGIQVNLGSPGGVSDNNINNWVFGIGAKKGTVVQSSSATIPASSLIKNYYLRLERLSKGKTQLSIFSDSARTVSLPGSPVIFTIDSTITGLNTIQHGVHTGGNSARMLNATLDNDAICDNNNRNEITEYSYFADCKIYPNPTNTNFIIETNFLQKQLLQIMDMNGRLVLNQVIQTTKSLIDVSNFVSGIYNISISGEEGFVNKKLVIIR